MLLNTEAAGLSDKGLVRVKNEDVWDSLPEENFFILADGMGGHQAGEVAAHKTVETICKMVKAYSFSIDLKQQGRDELCSLVDEAIKQANSNIYRMSDSDERFSGMGTTVCCLCVRSDFIVCAHVGDSRIYRLRSDELSPLTCDHSLAMDLIQSGQMTQEEAKTFKRKNVITKAVGIEASIEPTLSVFDVQEGDTYLLCSDGLTDYVNQELIKENLLKDDNLTRVSELLVEK
ncbi:Serine/threonine phosphatase stp, partial [Chlamydiales bacterium SCGC AB-751-O23]